MGRFDTTKATINANIKKNGNQEITGSILNSVMTEMVDATDAQLTELSAEVGDLDKAVFGEFKGVYYGDVTILSKEYIQGGESVDIKLILQTTAGAIKVVDSGNKTLKVFDVTKGQKGDEKTWENYVLPLNYDRIVNDAGYSGQWGLYIEIKRKKTSFEVLASSIAKVGDRIDAENVKLLEGVTLPFQDAAFSATFLDAPLVKGMVITDIGKANRAILVSASGDKPITRKMLPYVITETITSFYSDVANSGEMRVEGILTGLETEIDELGAKQESEKIYIREGVTLPFQDAAFSATFLDAPLVKGMVITDIGKANRAILVSASGDKPITRKMLPYVITETITSFYSDVANSGEMRVEGILTGLETEIDELGAKQESEKIYIREGVTLPFQDAAFSATFLDTPLVRGMVVTSIGNANYAQLISANGEHRVTKALLPYVINETITSFYADMPNSGEMRVEGLLWAMENGINEIETKVESIQNSILSKDLSYISMPIPQLAKVNIRANALPTTKTDNIRAELDFDNLCGNKFTKNIIINAQGTSSLALAKKNFSIDIIDGNYEDSHEIKFGDWVSQDSFHLKGYMLDGIRVKPLAAYDIYENMLVTRGLRKDRAWKRLQLPSVIPTTGNNIEDTYMQIDDGAKNHPSGFPIVVYFNNEFYGIYCWQLKKHRKNYHQEKKNAQHIHLDGNISNALLWQSNGVINWNKWSGNETESENSANREGIEIRNPKPLILINGTEYDGDTNRGELISTTSPNYDASNVNMVRTASVRTSLELLSSNVARLSSMTNGAEKKSAIADVFDVDSIIDYIIFSQLLGNKDGYNKNWQWVTYDGVKWAVNAYDLDGVWGWTSWESFEPLNYWFGTNTPPIALIKENYLDEIKVRYADLRRHGVISLEKIMQPLANYVRVIGIDYYEQEFEKWSDGERDNLWRFESWMEESIKRTDRLMEFVA